jgi:hypothetical protein
MLGVLDEQAERLINQLKNIGKSVGLQLNSLTAHP